MKIKKIPHVATMKNDLVEKNRGLNEREGRGQIIREFYEFELTKDEVPNLTPIFKYINPVKFKFINIY